METTMTTESHQTETRASTPDDMFVCPICLGVFETPRALACLHTFCEPCLEFYLSDLQSHAQKGRLTSIKCPVCSHETIPRDNRKLPHIMVKDLPLNHFLLPFLDSFEIYRSKSSKSRKQTPLKIMRNCSTCAERGEAKEAIAYCNECEEFQCDSCIKTHNRNKVLQKHSFVSIDKVTSVTEMISSSFDKNNACLDHQLEMLKCFCLDHEVLLCSSCVIDSHKACQVVSDFTELGRNLVNSKQPLQLQNNIKGLQKILLEVSEAAQGNNRSIKREADEITWKIKNMKEIILKLFDRLEERVNEDLQEYQEQIGKQNSERAFKCKKIAAALESSYKTIDSLLNYGSEHQIFAMFQRLKAQLQDFDKMTKDEIKDAQVTSLILNVDNKLTELVSNAVDLGEVLVKRSKPTLSDAPALVLPTQQKQDLDVKTEMVKNTEIKSKVPHIQWKCLSVCPLENNLALLFSVGNRAWMSYTVKLLHPETLEEAVSIDIKRDPKQLISVDKHNFVVTFPYGGFIDFFSYTPPGKKRKKKPPPSPTLQIVKTVKCDISDASLCQYSNSEFGYSTCNYFGLMDHEGTVKHLFLYSVSLGERETNFWCTQLSVEHMAVDWKRKRIYVAISRPKPKLYSFAENGSTMFEFSSPGPVVSLDLDHLGNVSVLISDKGDKRKAVQISANTGKEIREIEVEQKCPRFIAFNKNGGEFFVVGSRDDKRLTIVEKYMSEHPHIKEDLFIED